MFDYKSSALPTELNWLFPERRRENDVFPKRHQLDCVHSVHYSEPRYGDTAGQNKHTDMKNIITGKVLTKRDGSFKTFQYKLNGEVLRKSHREYGSGWRYSFVNQSDRQPSSGYHWTFGKRPDSYLSNRHPNVKATTQFPVVWEVTEDQKQFLSESARIAA
jgi:hypothetical protein